MRYFRHVLIPALLCCLSVALVSAQGTCPDITQTALQAVSDDCTTTGRNQACYGNGLIDLQSRDAATPAFESPGDLIDVSSIETLTLAPLDEQAGYWGIALLNVQANLPDTLPGQNVTMLIFGDAEITNAGDAMEAVYFRSGIGAPDCQQAPNGLLIQTPEGAGAIDLVVNDVQIRLGSTAFLQAAPEDDLVIAMLEGAAEVTADDVTLAVAAGEYTTVPLDENLSAAGAPAVLDVIEGNLELPELPLSVLPEANDDTAPSGETIIPLSGNWTFALGDVTLADGCPFNADMIRQGLQQFGTEATMTQGLDFGDDFDINVLLNTAEFDAAGVAYTIDNSSSNVYVLSLTPAEGVLIEYTYRIQSETLIEGDIYQSYDIQGMSGCTVEIPFAIEYAD